QVKAYWFDPRTGGAKAIGSFSNSGMQTFTPPSSGFDHDWVLVLDDAGKNYGLPGVGKAGR
ncbi:MAG TPA: putative collagen-binding domain-containing protein, partial [Cytophagales bacterium]